MNNDLNMPYQTRINKHLIEKIFKVSYLIFGIIPILWVISLIIFHHYVSSVFGFNPSYNNPEYSEFSNNILIVNSSGFLLGFWIISMWCSTYIYPTIFLINLILKFTSKIKLNYKPILFCLIGCLTIWLIWTSSSQFGNTFGWILD